MAERSLFRLATVAPTAEQRKRADQQRRRNLRIAIRQLERAELYLSGLHSLNLDDREAERTVNDLVQRIRSLERYLAEVRFTA